VATQTTVMAVGLILGKPNSPIFFGSSLLRPKVDPSFQDYPLMYG